MEGFVMKKRNKKIMAVFMALTLTSTIVPAYSYNVWAGEKENNANISVKIGRAHV